METKKRIYSVEEKMLKWVESNIYIIAMIGITLIAILVRVMLLDYVSVDAEIHLLPWYETLKETRFKGLAEQVGDYNILYQTIVVVLTMLPIKPIYAYKLFSCVFDFCLAGLISYIIRNESKADKDLKAVIAYAVVLLSPIVFLNSAYWSQCDAIYTFFAIFAIYMLYKEKYLSAFILLGVAFTFKMQTVFVLPFVLFAYFYRKRFSVVYFFLIPVVMIVLSLPGIMMGREISEVFTIYGSQTSSYPLMAVNYPSFWLLFQYSNMYTYYEDFKEVAILVTVIVLALYMLLWIKKKVSYEFEQIIAMLFIISYTCVLFLPSMHERYGFIYEILAIVIVFFDYKTLLLLALMYFTTFSTYGNFLFANPVDYIPMAWVNVLVYVIYVLYLHRKFLSKNRL